MSLPSDLYILWSFHNLDLLNLGSSGTVGAVVPDLITYLNRRLELKLKKQMDLEGELSV